MLMRYNMYSAAAVTGSLAPGTSSGEGIALMERNSDKNLKPGMDRDWTELVYMQLQAGNTAMYVFALAVVFVFLVLAAQYESWSLPLAVILVVPMCLLCSMAGVSLAGMDMNIFTQIGFVVLVGLASKNAILIVEFAKQQREAGVPRLQADDRGLPAAAAADPDDVVCLHPGRRSLGGGLRRRGRDAPHAGDGRLQRHARRDLLRHLPHPGLLLRHRRLRQGQTRPSGFGTAADRATRRNRARIGFQGATKRKERFNGSER